MGYFKIFTKVTSASLLNFADLLRDTEATTATELTFTKDTRKSLFIPIDKSVAARIILAFYNEFLDPAERIRDVLGAHDELDDHRISRVLVTYYLSCLKYITDFEVKDCIGLDSTFEILVDDLSAIPSSAWASYSAAKKESRTISPSMFPFRRFMEPFAFVVQFRTKEISKAGSQRDTPLFFLHCNRHQRQMPILSGC